MSEFFGKTYLYPTPNDGKQKTGVTRVLGNLYAVCWIAANGSRKRIKSPNLVVSDNPATVQARFEYWAASRGLEEVTA